MEKEKKITEDDQGRFSDEVQKATDQAISDIDHSLEAKEK
jgi:ribosome recycling factor